MSLNRIELALRSGLGVAVSVLLSAIAVICFLEVILRYVFAASLSWYDELVGYLPVWLTFLGAVLAQSHGQHVGIGDLVERAPARARRALSLASHLVLVAVHLVLLVYGAQLAMRFSASARPPLPCPWASSMASFPSPPGSCWWWNPRASRGWSGGRSWKP